MLDGGELFYAFYRQVPGGQSAAGITSERQTTSPELLVPREDCLLVMTAPLRYSEAFEGLTKVEVADHGLAFLSASSLVQLAQRRHCANSGSSRGIFSRSDLAFRMPRSIK